MTTETLPQVVTEDRSLVFGTTEPSGIIVKATKIADSLVPLIEKKKLYKVIGPKKHVYVEGWNTMLAMLGIFPRLVHSLRLDRAEEIAYSARVELVHLSGSVVGAGEALCSSLEKNWANKDEFQVSSMAQTRATGKAARLSFSWIMNLAGYAEVPAEEMTGEETEVRTVQPPVAKVSAAVSQVFGGKSEDPNIGTVEAVIPKDGGTPEKPWRKYGVKINGEFYGTFDEALGATAESLRGKKVKYAWTPNAKKPEYKDLTAIEAA